MLQGMLTAAPGHSLAQLEGGRFRCCEHSCPHLALGALLVAGRTSGEHHLHHAFSQLK